MFRLPPLPEDEILRAGAGVAASLTAAGGWVVAQAAAIDSPLEVVGGGILAVVGVLALRMVMTASNHSRRIAVDDEARLARRIEDLERDLHDERNRSARLLLAYDRERNMRASFEEAGSHDRRHPTPELDPAGLVILGDREDLADELHAAGIPDADDPGA